MGDNYHFADDDCHAVVVLMSAVNSSFLGYQQQLDCSATWLATLPLAKRTSGGKLAPIPVRLRSALEKGFRGRAWGAAQACGCSLGWRWRPLGRGSGRRTGRGPVREAGGGCLSSPEQTSR
jgi:hypothetical protein